MSKLSRHIIWLSMQAGGLSISYFLTLIFHLPVLVALILFTAWVTGTYAFVVSKLRVTEHTETKQELVWTAIVLAVGFYMLVNDGCRLADKYGAWDAWWFWNYHAKFLADPGLWKEAYTIPSQELLTTRVAHADYPLLLPVTVGFFWRLLHTNSNLIPFLIGFLYTCLVPLMIFSELRKRNLVVASLIFLAIIDNEHFIGIGVSQLGDILISFFFLAAYIGLQHFRTSGDKRYGLLCGIMLGCCIWTKNEGMMLALLLLLFHIDILGTGKKVPYLLAGASPFLIALIVFKAGYAPANDIAAGQQGQSWARLHDWQRYQMVYDGFRNSMEKDYAGIKMLLALSAVVSLLQRTIPLRNVGLIAACMLGYLLAYILSPHNVEWHVNTSIDRVMLQFMPVVVYMAARRISEVRLSLT